MVAGSGQRKTMEESRFILDLAIAFGAALLGGLIARLLKQTALLG